MTSTQAPSTLPDAHADPRGFLEHLYRVAVERALPLASMGAHLPPPPKGRTLVLGAGRPSGRGGMWP
jgi:glycerate 2-kinase